MSSAVGRVIRRQFEGTRFEPLVEGMRRSRWPRVWRVGEKDHQAIHTLLPALVRSRSCCIDVGANRGEMLAEFVRLAPLGSHVAFEPLPELAEALKQRHPSVRIEQAAVSDRPGRATFHRCTTDDALSGLQATHDGDEVAFDVSIVTLDEALADLSRGELIKIEVEGAELGVMRGAAQTLQTHRPQVIFEFQRERAPAYNTTPCDIWDELVRRHSYELLRVDGSGSLSLDQFQHAFDVGDCYNFLARPID